MIRERKKKIKKEYIYVFVSLVILVGLIVGLIYTINYKVPVEEVTSESKELFELPVDTSDTSCSQDKISEFRKNAEKISIKREETKAIVGKGVDIESDNGDLVDVYGNGFKLIFNNVSKDFNINITNDYDKEEITLTEKDIKDGKVTYTTTKIEEKVTYSVKIFIANSSCKDILIRQFDYVTPKFNQYSKLIVCKDNNNPKCDKYADTSSIGLEDFIEEVKNDQRDQKGNKDNTSKNQKNKFIIISVVVGILAVIGVIILVMKRGNKNEK